MSVPAHQPQLPAQGPDRSRRGGRRTRPLPVRLRRQQVPACARPDARSLLSNLPPQLPVVRGEIEIVRIHFSDLIASVLQDKA